MAVVINYHKLCDSKQHKCMILHFWRLKSEIGLTRLESRY